MTQTFFEIAIPFRGNESFLKDTVQSVVNQEHKFWRLVIFDNDSASAGFQKWLANLADTRIVYKRNSLDIGLTANFEKARKSLNSSWGMILGADDLLLPNYLARIAPYTIAFKDACFIHPGVVVIDSNGKVINPLVDRIKHLISKMAHNGKVTGKNRFIASLMIGNWMYFPSILWNMKYLKGHKFDPNLYMTLDLDIAIKAVSECGSMVKIPDKIFFYRRHGASASNDPTNIISRLEEEGEYYSSINLTYLFLPFHLRLLAKLRFSNRLHAFLCLFSKEKSYNKTKLLRIAFL